MTPVTIGARFPLGQYNAHDGNGEAEWPPHPARLAAAALAAANSHAHHVNLARRIYTWEPPTIWAPPGGLRDSDWSRWVPVDVPVNMAARIGASPVGTRGVYPKLSKPPERGVILDHREVLFNFAGTDLQFDETADLDELLGHVPYLGRPTSPVVLRRHQTFQPSLDTGDLYQPDPHGDHRLRIPTPALLVSLDQRERLRDLAGDPGFHPQMPPFPEATYRHVPLGDPRADVTQANRRTVDTILRTLSWCQTPQATPDDITKIIDLLPPEHVTLPAYGTTSSRGLVTQRLFGIFVHPVLQGDLWAPIDGELIRLRPRPSADTHANRTRISQAWATSAAWTTTVPLPTHNLATSVQDLGDRVGACIVEAQTHQISRTANGPDTRTNPRYTHLSILFDRAIMGPIQLAGAQFIPIKQTD